MISFVELRVFLNLFHFADPQACLREMQVFVQQSQPSWPQEHIFYVLLHSISM